MLLSKLQARKAEIAALREDRGATDPILIIAGIAITLILLVGGSFAIAGFMDNARNLNAKGDLQRIATAQAAFMAENDSYAGMRTGPTVLTPTTATTDLRSSSIGFVPTEGNNIIVLTSASGWVAVTESASGAVFLRGSVSTETLDEVDAGSLQLPAGIVAADVTAAISGVQL